MSHLFNLFTAGKSSKGESITLVMQLSPYYLVSFTDWVFQIISKQYLPGDSTDKLLPLGEFALGIECAQLIVVIIALILSFIVQTIFQIFKTRLDTSNVGIYHWSCNSVNHSKSNLAPIKSE